MYCSGASAIIVESANEWTAGACNRYEPADSWSSLYKTQTAEVGAQFEAIVGKVNTGFSSLAETVLPVSMARPPPTAKIISAA